MVTSVLAMEGQLRELRERASASTAALRALAEQGEEVEALVQRKRSLKPLVVELRSEADTLTRRLKDSSTVVQRVVESVRVLDTAQANTRKALERTVDIVGLKTCVEEVAAAMQSENWEKAADVMQRHLKVRKYRQTQTCEGTHARHTHTNTHTLTHVQCHIYARAHTHTHTHTHLHTHTHTQTEPLIRTHTHTHI